MPEPLHPPYNIVTPRQLDRWLDVNAQNGALTRTRGFVSVPFNIINQVVVPQTAHINISDDGAIDTVFSFFDSHFVFLGDVAYVAGNPPVTFNNINNVAKVFDTAYGGSSVLNFPNVGWSGTARYATVANAWTLTPTVPTSNKILQFNFSATNNFCLQRDSYYNAFVSLFEGVVTVCLVNIIAGTNGNPNTVIRYKLTSDSMDTVQAIPYTGQTILKGYFQIEFWSLTNFNGTINPRAAMILNTSVLGNLDYRYGNDFSIVSTSPVAVTNFQNTSVSALNSFNLPITFNQNTINGAN